LTDIVAKRFCSSDRARLIQGRGHGSARLIQIFGRSDSIVADSLFHRTLAATFATISADMLQKDFGHLDAQDRFKFRRGFTTSFENSGSVDTNVADSYVAEPLRRLLQHNRPPGSQHALKSEPEPRR
jgi:hypothetical protein